MRTIEQVIYKYSELDDSAKQSAKEWFSQGGYTWIDEGIDSIRAFCKHYGVKLEDYSISPYSYSYIKTNVENHHLRGIKFKQVEKEKGLTPTGYCLDCDLFSTMYESMRDNGGNALSAFLDAIEAGKRGIIADMEWQDSDEYIEEMMDINDYEFNEQGRRV
jgi:ribosome assembly protein YihI (activator of Der GTPase)